MLTMTQKCEQSRQADDRSCGVSAHGCESQFASSDLEAAAASVTVSVQNQEQTGFSGIASALYEDPVLSDADQQLRIATICDGVIDIVAALFNVSGRDLRSPGRSPLAVSRVRQIAMYVTHVALRLSMRDVGQGFGRDRTTVLYACHQIEDLREQDEFDDIVARVEQVVTIAFGAASGRG